MTALRPNRIVLVTSMLGGGGAERILLTMAEWWVGQGRDVTVVALRRNALNNHYPIPAGVKVEQLGLLEATNPLWNPRQLTSLIRLRRKLLSLRPDLVISFLDKLNAAVLLALVGTAVPVVATEHLAPWCNPLGRVWELLRSMTYRRAKTVISPTDRITHHLQSRVKGHFLTLPSPAKLDRYAGAEKPHQRRAVIAAMGRLEAQKGFDLLVRAAAPVLREHPEWTVEIAGGGSMRGALDTVARAEGVEGRIRFLGHLSEVEAWLLGCEIFALTSRHEAYPMALCEAMAAGCAVVAFDCPTGPREILGTPPSGRLLPAEDVGALEKHLRELVESAAARSELASAALERARLLHAPAVMPLWDRALAEAME
jgi:GalNAc-alpha-(1->4)-GalNAc-alpha-(1->3)-diNAcBac-PP-undecaprenol alpha-1,4-N-acetyl-D-galactosaminyltransferase